MTSSKSQHLSSFKFGLLLAAIALVGGSLAFQWDSRHTTKRRHSFSVRVQKSPENPPRGVGFQSSPGASNAFNRSKGLGSSSSPSWSTSSSSSPSVSSSSMQQRNQQRPSISSYQHNAVAFPFQASSSMEDASVVWDDLLATQKPPSVERTHVTTTDKALLAATTGFLASALYLLLSMSSPGSWRYFLAGGICAALSHAVPTPVDVVKTRKQIDPSLAGKTFLQVSREITQNEGKRALWAGIGPTFWGYLFEGAVKFGVYEVLKPGVKAILARVAAWTSIGLFDSKIVTFVLCGTASGVAASFMVCPMEALRIRMVSEPEFAPHGMLQGGYKMLQREGVSGLSKGMKPMLMKQVPYTITKNVSFDFLTTFFYAILRMQGVAMSAATSFTVPLVAAGIASILSCIISQPGDMLLSLINAHEGEISTRDLLRNVLRSKQGVRGLFVGFKTRMLHVGIIVTLQLLIYDYAKRLCGIAATGSV